MGKCMSCCEQPYRPTQNGHSVTSAPPLSKVSGLESEQLRVATVTTPAPPVACVYEGGGGGGDGNVARRASVDDKPVAMTAGGVNETLLTSLFDRYSDSEQPDCILADGTERLCADLQLHPEEFRVLLLAWRLNADSMCRFTRDQFVGGCRAMRVDSLRGLRAKLPHVEVEVRDPAVFRDLYRWAYRFALDAGERTLPVAVAGALWRVVFARKAAPLLPRWLAFLEAHPRIRAIPRDTWDMFLNFSDTVGEDLSAYDDTDAWPSLFDDFVEYENDCRNQNVKRDKDVWQ